VRWLSVALLALPRLHNFDDFTAGIHQQPAAAAAGDWRSLGVTRTIDSRPTPPHKNSNTGTQQPHRVPFFFAGGGATGAGGAFQSTTSRPQ